MEKEKRTSEINNEMRLMVLLNRLTFTQTEIKEVKELLESDLYWPEVYRIAIKNRVIGLAYHNLERLKLSYLVPSKYRRNGMFYTLGNGMRNKSLIMEYKNIIKKMNDEGIKCAPLKGVFLVPNLYENYGSRDMNDVDILINRKDSKKVLKIMEELGYLQGRFNQEINDIENYTKEKKMLWKMKMNNLCPFVKKSGSEYHKYYKFDFSFNLDLDITVDPVQEMLDGADEIDGMHYLKPKDFFLHLCCHLYKEATNAEWIYINSDINLIKFCDVREYIQQKMDKTSLKESVNFAKEYGLEKAIYFTVFYLKELYNDGYEDEVLDYIDIEEVEFLNQYGKRNFEQEISWNKNFWERLSSDTNKDEIVYNKKFQKQFENYLKL